MVSDVDAVIVEANALYRAEGLAVPQGALDGLAALRPLRPIAPAPVPAPVAAAPESIADDAPAVPDTVPQGMVRVAGGAFLFGEERASTDVATFCIDRYPVTNSQYAAFVAATGHRAPRYWTGATPPPSKLDHPVVGVTCDDAAAYLVWCGKRLPTEAEWEKAARGTDGRVYPWGDAFTTGMANVSGAEIKDTTAVGRYRQGASVYGCEELAGNVWEWTSTRYVSGGTNLTLKGGSWYDFSNHARADHRFSAPPEHEGACVGFRGVWDATSALPTHVPIRTEETPGAPDVMPQTGRRAAIATTVALGDPFAIADVVESTVGAMDDYDVHSAKARIDELFTPLEPLPGTARPQPVPAATTSKTVDPSPAGRFVPHRLRIVAAALLVVVPLSVIGVVVFDTSDATPETPESVAPSTPAPKPAAAKPAAPSVARTEPAPPVVVPTPAPKAARSKTPEAAPAATPAATPSPRPAAGMPAAPPGMVAVPAGEFLYGARETRKPVFVKAFFIDRHEVTNEAFAKFVAATKYPAPRHTRHWRNGRVVPGYERFPVTMIDHGAARQYAAWVGKRLPTEIEWEKAARGTDGRKYPWGDGANSGHANLFPPVNSQLGPRAVGSYPSGRSPFGCDDMCGNVLEWTSSRDGLKFVLRGGSWGMIRSKGVLSHRYLDFAPESRSPIVGFRCVQDVPDPNRR